MNCENEDFRMIIIRKYDDAYMAKPLFSYLQTVWDLYSHEILYISHVCQNICRIVKVIGP